MMKQTTTKKIQFDTIEIRTYPVVLSNNPACEYGPSIELGWNYNKEEAAHKTIRRVSQYEKERFGKRRREKPGRPSQMYLSQVRREAILHDLGYSDKEVKKAMKDKRKARRQRSVSKFLSTGTRIKATVNGRRKERKVMRAVRNLKKRQEKNNSNGECDGLFFDNSTVYKGWWIPFSAYIL